jgi:hypothetical protein
MYYLIIFFFKKLNDSAASAHGVRSWKLSSVGRSLDGQPKIFLSGAPPCFGRHVKPLVSAAFIVVSTHQSALDPYGSYGPFSSCVILKKRPVPQQ